jgi:hypothetical protein
MKVYSHIAIKPDGLPWLLFSAAKRKFQYKKPTLDCSAGPLGLCRTRPLISPLSAFKTPSPKLLDLMLGWGYKLCPSLNKLRSIFAKPGA